MLLKYTHTHTWNPLSMITSVVYSRTEKFKLESPNLTEEMREALIERLGSLVTELGC